MTDKTPTRRPARKKKPVPKAAKAAAPAPTPSSHSKKPFRPTAEQRQQVEAMVGFGLTQEQVCLLVINPETGHGITVETLQRYFEQEVLVGIAKADLQVVQALHRNAVGRAAEYDREGRVIRAEVSPNVTAQIWWTKARMGWREPEPLNPNVGKNYAGADGARRRLAHLLDADAVPEPAGKGTPRTH